MFLGIDLGTGSVKALLLDPGGAAVAEGHHAYAIASPEPGYAETHPDTWWEAIVLAVRACCAGRADRVRGIGLSGQAHGLVLVDRAHRPLRPAILWPDLRATRELEHVLALPERLRLPLCNPVASGMAALSLGWVSRREGALLARACKMLSPKDWVRARLTGELVTEPSDASMTLLYDMLAGDWATDLVAALGIDRSLLPEIVPSESRVGSLRPAAAEALGLPAGVPVAAGLADTAACLLGLGAGAPGGTVLQIGSGIQIMTVVERVTPEIQPFYNTYRGAGSVVYKMAAMLNGGTAFEWVRRVLRADWDEMYRAAFEPDPGNGGIVFLPYASGERAPLLDPHAAAALTGMRLGCEREHVLRAIFEGVALAIRDSWDALQTTGASADQMLLTGGGSRDPRWRQLIADFVGVPMQPVVDRGGAARGAAYLGGLVAGHWSGIESLPGSPAGDALVVPRARDDIDALLARFRATYRGLKE